MSVLRIERRDRVAILTFDDPDRRNVVSDEMNDELLAAFDELEADEGIGAVVVTGAGRDHPTVAVEVYSGTERVETGVPHHPVTPWVPRRPVDRLDGPLPTSGSTGVDGVRSQAHIGHRVG